MVLLHYNCNWSLLNIYKLFITFVWMDFQILKTESKIWGHTLLKWQSWLLILLGWNWNLNCIGNFQYCFDLVHTLEKCNFKNKCDQYIVFCITISTSKLRIYWILLNWIDGFSSFSNWKKNSTVIAFEMLIEVNDITGL